jgi:putative sigma-54 modulation protein
MQFQFSFKHMETSDALTSYAETKIRDKIMKFVTKPIDAHVTFSVDRHNHMAHLSVHGGDGFNLQVEHTCEDMYGSVDRVVDKLEVQLKKHKEKLKNHKVKDKHERLEILTGGAKTVEEDAIDAEEILRGSART